MIGRRGLAIGALSGLAMPAIAQARPMRLVVPNPPGGQSDTIARLYGEAILAATGQTVTVDNRTGANGLIAMDAVAKSAPDGLTLGVFSITTFTALPLMMARMPLDVDRDLTPVTSIVTSTVLCCVTAERARERGWTGFGALLEWAKRPGHGVTNGAASNGGASHLIVATIARRTGADMTVVPYRGGAPALNDLLGGNIDMVFDFMPALLPHVASGRLVPLAVGTRERVSLLPDVPAMGEFPQLGIADMDLQSWNALTGPAGMPEEVQARVVAMIRRANAVPGLEERLRRAGLLPMPPLEPAAVRARIAAERPRWREMVDASGARMD